MLFFLPLIAHDTALLLQILDSAQRVSVDAAGDVRQHSFSMAGWAPRHNATEEVRHWVRGRDSSSPGFVAAPACSADRVAKLCETR